MEHDKSVTQMQQAAARTLSQTPGLASQIKQSRPSSGSKGTGAAGKARQSEEQDALIKKLMATLESEKEKVRELEAQYTYRVGSFLKRETQHKKTLETLEKQLQSCTDDEHRSRMSKIREMHDGVTRGLEQIQNQTAMFLRTQEKDLMRAFRARLQDVSQELEAQRNKKGDFNAELQAKHRRVKHELHASQELAQTFDKKNLELQEDNARLLEKLRTREDDRQCLSKELVIATREVAKYKQLVDEMKARPDRTAYFSNTGPPSPGSPAPGDDERRQEMYNAHYERAVKYRKETQALQRHVTAERRIARQLRDQQAKFLASRTELEILLRQRLDDVKMEVAKRREEATGTQFPTGTAGQALSAHAMQVQDRERVLELLLSDPRAIELLYDKSATAPAMPISVSANSTVSMPPITGATR